MPGLAVSDALRAAAESVGVTLETDAVGRIGRFLDLLQIWNRRLRLTGERDRELLVRKHVPDCLAVAAELPGSGMVFDIGSGPGFPGVVLGCVRPDLELALIEPRRRPASFLSEAIRTIPLPNAGAYELRAESAGSMPGLAGRGDLLVSRALRLDTLLAVSRALLAPGGRLVAMQTPSTTPALASELGGRAGWALTRIRDYALPGGERRRLLIFELG